MKTFSPYDQWRFLISLPIGLVGLLFSVGLASEGQGLKPDYTDLSEGYQPGDWKLGVHVEVRASSEGKEPILCLKLERHQAGKTRVFEYSEMIDFHVHVFDEKGTEVPLTKLGEKLASTTVVGKGRLNSLLPGKPLVYEINLKECFQLLPARTYRVTARRYLSELPIDRTADGRKAFDESKIRLIFVESKAVKFTCP